MTSSPTERAQSAATTASDEGRHVAGVAREEAGHVASEAANQARQVMDQAMSQVSTQSKEQKDRLAGTVRTFGEDLESMTSQASPGLAQDLTRQVSGYARTISDHLQSREPGELLEDVRSFARRRPGAFLLGALAAGVVVGRLARGTADGIAGAKYAEETSSGTGIATAPTTTGVPTAPTPVYSGGLDAGSGVPGGITTPATPPEQGYTTGTGYSTGTGDTRGTGPAGGL